MTKLLSLTKKADPAGFTRRCHIGYIIIRWIKNMKRMLSLAAVLAPILAPALFAACDNAERPPTASDLLDLGEKYLLASDYEQAVLQFTGLIEIEPKNPRGYTGLAEAYIGLGDTDKAVDALRRGLEEMPDDPAIKAMLDGLAEPLYYDTLTGEQQALLAELENALRSYDYVAADAMQRSDEYRAIVDGIPGEEKHTRYSPDDETMLYLFREDFESVSYHADAYVGRGGEGLFIGGNCSGDFYSMHVVEYSGGRANGAFTDYILSYEDSEVRFSTHSGYAKDGQGYGKIVHTSRGETYETDDADQIDWWPDWAGQ
jgi:hypothetical protein